MILEFLLGWCIAGGVVINYRRSENNINNIKSNIDKLILDIEELRKTINNKLDAPPTRNE